MAVPPARIETLLANPPRGSHLSKILNIEPFIEIAITQNGTQSECLYIVMPRPDYYDIHELPIGGGEAPFATGTDAIEAAIILPILLMR
jgi:hypothetical protein